MPDYVDDNNNYSIFKAAWEKATTLEIREAELFFF